MKSKLARGALSITVATFLVKILSIVYKVPYQNITGDKGFYIYQQLYPFYTLIVSMATFAFPLAISEVLTNNKNEKQVLSSIFTVLMLLSFISIFFISLFSQPLAILFNDRHLNALFLPIIPVFLLIPVTSIIRGSLYSNIKTMNRVGISLIIEQIFRVGFILFILYQFYHRHLNNLYDVAKYSLLGFGVGLLISTLYLFLQFDYRIIKLQSIDLKVGTHLIKRGMFLLISSSMLLLFQLMDSLTIVNALSFTIDVNEAMIIKGIYDRSLPLIQTALFFVSPLLSSILPHIKTKEQYGKLITIILFVALPATFGLGFIMEDLNILLFGDNKLTYTLQINTLLVLLYALFLTLTSIIKSQKKMTMMIFVGIILKYSLNVFLIRTIGITGAPISSIITLLILISSIIILSNKEIKIYKMTLYKIMVASFMMFSILFLFNQFVVSNNLILNLLIGMF